jgi:amino acid transporter
VSKRPRHIGFWSVVSIGIGGMVGGGIFAVLGLAVQLSKGGAPLAFFVGGVVALLTAYSYSKLSVTFQSQGGTVTFLDRAFTPNVLVGGMNTLLWLSYIVMLALYSSAFGSYGAAFAPSSAHLVVKHILISLSVVVITGLNMFSADVIGRAETWIVGLKVSILLLFIAVGLTRVNLHQVSPSAWAPPMQVVAGGMIIFLAYEGFELIANTAHDVKDARRVLPKAFFASVSFVIVLYILVALVTVGSLSTEKIVAAKDYALAVAAVPFLGRAGFTLIACAALLSTASAINATLYGAARLSFTIAKEGEFPRILEKKIWNKPIEGLFITAAMTVLIANTFDLSSISTMGSAGFLLLFAAVNGANLRLREQTGSNFWIPLAGLLACSGALISLIWQTYSTDASRLWTLVIMVALAMTIEWLYRRFRRGDVVLQHTTTDQ